MAITTFTGDLSAFFAAGTSLEARPASNWPAIQRPPATGTTPVGAATATATSNSSGVVAFTGLADSSEYYVSDAAGTRYVRITTYPERQELMTSDVGVDVPAIANLSVNVKDYGARGDGISETGAAFRNAYAAAILLGRDLFIPAGTYYINDPTFASVFQLARDNAGTAPAVDIEGEAGTIIKGSALTPRLIDFNKQADHDTFRKHHFRKIVFDANSIGGSHHVFAGTLQNGTFQSRMSFDDITFDECHTINVAGDSTNTIDRRNFAFVVRHLASDEATQDTITGLAWRRCTMLGGSYGIEYGGTCPGNSANVYCDRIVGEDCYHDTLQTYTANHGGANFFGPSAGYGGSVTWLRCTGKRSGDVGNENDAMTDVLVDDCTIEDSVECMYFSRNFHTPESQTGQTHRYVNSTAKVVTLNPDVAGSIRSRGWEIGHVTAPTPVLGHAILDNCAFRSVQTAFSNSGQAIYAQDTPVERVTVNNFTADVPGINYTPTANRFGDLVRLILTGTSRVEVRNLTMKWAGTILTGGGFAAQTGGLKVSSSGGGTMTFLIDGVNIYDTVSGTGASVGEKVRLGQSTGTMRGVVRGVNPQALTAAPAFGGSILYIHGTGTLTVPSNGAIVVEDNDFSKITGTTNTPITFEDTTNRPKVRIEPSNVLNLGVFASSVQPNIASAGTVTLPHAGDHFVITGTTNITSITASWAGRLVTLSFSGILTFTDGSNLLLAGNLPTTADDTITLRCDGTNWIEVARSVN